MAKNAIFGHFSERPITGHKRSYLVTPGHTFVTWYQPYLVTGDDIWSHLGISGHKSHHLVTEVTVWSKVANWSHFDIFAPLLSRVTFS